MDAVAKHLSFWTERGELLFLVGRSDLGNPCAISQLPGFLCSFHQESMQGLISNETMSPSKNQNS